MFPITALALTAAAQTAGPVDEPLFDDALNALGTVTYEDSRRLPPAEDAPLWVEVAVFLTPDAEPCHHPCRLRRADDRVWSGEASLGEDGAWTAELERGPRALRGSEPAPAVHLARDFAVQLTAQLPTTPERCFDFCAAQARHAADLQCVEATDRRVCEAGERVKTRDRCEVRCMSDEAFGLRGTTWITTGRAHTALEDGDLTTVVAPDIELERIVDASGQPVDW